MRININLVALNTKNQLSKNNKTTANIMEKLSSGKRINKAADDAAGLAISQKMRAQIRGLNQADENVQDGISLIQTAEGALNEMEDMTQRMRELSVQGANDTLTTEDREKIQKELDALKKQIDVIANTTEFNTRKLLNGDIQTEMKSVSKSIDLNIPLDGSIVSTSIDIEGETIDLNFTDDLLGNTVVNIEESGEILVNEILEKANEEAKIIWEKSFGGSSTDRANEIKKTSDNGYIIIGTTSSDDGDISINSGLSDFWVTKLDSLGNLEWEKTYGGASHDSAYSINETLDGGYILGGTINSDYGLIKLDSLGNLEWEKTYGGSSGDRIYNIEETSDGGYIASGYSASSDGDVSSNNGIMDYWITKFDISGELEWEKSYGGTSSELAIDMKITSDSGYIITGVTYSNDGDINSNNGRSDYWVVKLNSLGNLEWEKNFGDTSYDGGSSIIETNDGGYITIGQLSEVGNPLNHSEKYNIGVFKIDGLGNLEWNKIYGGSSTEYASDIKQLENGDFIIIGSTESNDIHVEKNNGNLDYWLLEIDNLGNILWENTFGGSDNDTSKSLIVEDNSFIIAGYSESSDIDVSSTNKGRSDYWITKIKAPVEIINDINNTINLNESLTNENITIENIELSFENNKYEKVTDIKVNYSKKSSDNGLIIQAGANAGQTVKIGINDIRSEALGMINGYPKVITRKDAEISIAISDEAIQKLSSERSRLGAKQNRLEYISNNLTNSSENLQNAESSITDSDMAKQVMKLAKNDILIQATQSMLAQANNLPKGVLELIK